MKIVAMEQAPRDRGISFQEFSERFGISERTTRRLISAGKLKAVRISARRQVIMESEVARITLEGVSQSPVEA